MALCRKIPPFGVVIGELDFFDIIVFVLVFEFDNIARGNGKLDFFYNIEFISVFKVDNIAGEIGELDFIELVVVFELALEGMKVLFHTKTTLT
jgi:hypothetical protein